MQEVLELAIQYLRDFWRYRWYAVGVAFLIIPIGWIAISKMPITYTARAKVYVDTYTVLQPLLKGIVLETDPNAYLGLMARELVSRPNLEQVARMVGLDRSDSENTSQEREQLLARIERSVQLTGSRTRDTEKQSDLYVISYEGEDPELSKQIVEALITTFEQRTEGESRRDSEAAKRFLAQQIEEQGEKLTTAENSIREFKQEHLDVLPEEGVSYFQRLHAAQAAVDNIDLEISAAEYRRNELQRQLAKTPANQRAVSTDGKPILTDLESRVLALQTRLDELVLKYTEKHPDVITTRRSLAELKKQQARDTPTNLMPNPVYQQLKITLGQADGEIAALWAKRDEYVRRVQSLRRQTESLTKVEAELQLLTRIYETEKEKFDALISRQNSANMTGNLEKTGEDVRFRVIDPPRIVGGRAADAQKRLLLAVGVPSRISCGGFSVSDVVFDLAGGL
ncbi:MAG: lipopolysaccharide biosynthesis protein [Candidatus Competibacteraceae bacterium]